MERAQYPRLGIEGATYWHGSAPRIHIGASLHDVPERDEDDEYEKDGEEGNEDYNDYNEKVNQGDTPKDEDNEEEEEDEDNAQFVNINPVPPKCWTQSQQAQQDEQESSLVTEILSDDERQQKSQMGAQKASKELASPSDSQPSSQGEGNKPVPKETDLQDKDEMVMKEVAKLNTKNRVQIRALSEAHDQCYAADKLCAQKVRGAILDLGQIPSVDQIHKRDLFKLGPPGNRIVDDIHSHWESYFHKYGVLANVPYSKFQTAEGWDAVYTWDSLKRHEPALADTYTKKATRPSLMVVVAPTTTEIGDDYFLNKLHELACVKRRSVYYSAKMAGKRSHVQVVICPYCRVLSQNAPSGCSHIRRHLGLAFACGGCRLFRTEAPKETPRAPRKV